MQNELVALGGLFRLEDLSGERMVSVHHHVVVIRKVAHAHESAATGRTHFFHAAHVFGHHHHHRQVVAGQSLDANAVVLVVDGAFDVVLEALFFGIRQQVRTLAFFRNQFVEHVAVHTCEANFFFGALDFLNPVPRNRRVEQYHVVAFGLGLLDVAVLAVFVRGIEHHLGSLFVGLQGADFLEVLVNRVVLLVHRAAQQAELLGALKKLVVSHHSVLDDDGDVLELLLEVGTVGLEHFFELVSHLFGDVAADFFNVSVGLQVAARYVERNVFGVNNPVQHHQEFRNDSLDIVSHKNLRLVELDFVLVQLHVGLDFREE